MKMKAAVPREQGGPRPFATSKPMTIETVDLDPPGPGEGLYKVIGAGLCHSGLSARELCATDTFLAGNADVVEKSVYVIETAGSIPASWDIPPSSWLGLSGPPIPPGAAKGGPDKPGHDGRGR
jgi:hypothetical protein